MISKVTLYKNSNSNYFAIKKEKNMIVEKIEKYLESFEHVTFNNVQRIKIDLNTTIKLSINQEYQEMRINKKDSFCYCKIEMIESDIDTTKNSIYYFFINKINWLGVETIQLELMLDSLNTFQELDIDPTTNIQRQHKDRFVKAIKKLPLLSLSLPTTAVLEDRQYYTIYEMDGEVEEYYATIYVDEWMTHEEGSPIWQTDNYRIEIDELADLEDKKLIFRSLSKGKTIKVEGDSIQITPNFYLGTMNEAFNLEASTINLRKIDKIQEDFNPVLFNVSKKEINDDTDKNGKNWYLIYRNEKAVSPDDYENPVNCFLVNDEKIQVQFVTEKVIKKQIVARNLREDTLYKILFTTGAYNAVDSYGNQIGAFGQYTYLYRIGNQIYYYFISESTIGSPWTGIKTDYIELKAVDESITSLNVATKTNPKTKDDGTGWNEEKLYFDNSPSYILSSIKDIDKTDSKIIKIIKLPFAPLPLNYDTNNYLLIGDEWGLYQEANVFTALKLRDLNTKFSKEITSSIFNPLSKLWTTLPTYTNNKSIGYESKLFSSQFYYNKFVYDSFVKPFYLENIKLEDYTTSNEHKFEFITSTTISSKFMFKFNISYQLQNEDFANIIPVSRNNEIVLYNSAYINYIRNGYNYDRQKQTQNAVVGSIAGTGGSLASLGIGLALQNPLMVIGGAIGAVGSLVSNISTYISNEREIEQKLTQTKNQSISVQGSDDIDLLTAYSNNKPHQIEYSVSDELKNMIFNLFHYCGYKENKIGIPNLDSRMWFNFIQCDLVLRSFALSSNEEVQKDIIDKFKAGVTKYHYTDNAWDFKQEKENAERRLQVIYENEI